nr:dihydroxy-acid dehydratase [Angustibacter aerolatus]
MGLHLPGSAFIAPTDPLRDALTAAATKRVAEIAASNAPYGIGHVVDERVVVNGAIALLATGGSTNHTMHLVAMAAAAGIDLRWDDLDDLSRVIPLLARMYPSGTADVNQFHVAGGTPYLVRTLLDAGLLHGDVLTLAGRGLERYTRTPVLGDDGEPDLPRRPGRQPRPHGAAPGRRPVRPRRRAAAGARQPRPGSGQGVVGGARAPRRRGPRAGLRRPDRRARGVQPPRGSTAT